MENPDTSPSQVKPKLLTRLRQAIRVRQYALRTEEVYFDWVRRYIHFHGLRHPQDLGGAEASDLPWLDEVVTAKPFRHLPVVLTTREVERLLHELSGASCLVAALLYGTGTRLLEGLRLRVKDVKFTRQECVVRDGKGDKDRVTVLPENQAADECVRQAANGGTASRLVR